MAGGAAERAARPLSPAELVERRAVKVRRAAWKLSVPDEPGVRTDVAGAMRLARRWRKLMDVVRALEGAGAGGDAGGKEIIYMGGSAR